MNTTADRFPIDRTPPTWLLLVLSGVLLGLAYPPNPIGLFGSIGLVPLLVALERARTYRQAFRWSYGAFFIFSALSSWWIGSWQARSDKFLMISCVLLIIIHPLFFIVPMMIYRAVRRSTSLYVALAFLPFLWCGGEYLHALGDASYPWLTLGNTQTYNIYYIQFIEFTGVWGLSFLLLVQNSILTAMLFSLRGNEAERRRMFKTGIAILALTLIPPFLYGIFVLNGNRGRLPEKTLTVTVVQPNEDPWDKWNQADTTNHIRLNGDIALASPGRRQTDMFLWVETAVPVPVTAPGFEGKYAELQQMVDTLGVPLLTGFPDYLEYPDAASAPPSAKMFERAGGPKGLDTVRFDHFNSAGLFLPGKGLAAAYHKMQLVPFGERIPFIDNVPWLSKMLNWGVGISTWGKGHEIVTMPVPYRGGIARAGSVVCFESVYPNVVRKFVDSGANFMTIITNDGWYMGTPGPLQHERIAIMRAIETRRSIARAANTGISCFITPYGSIVNETPENERTTTTGAIELRSDNTLYVQWGDWWPHVCLAAALGFIAFAIVSRLRRRGQEADRS
ncbi:MAG TPA: apolipoprotein N-acyltransferase [Candidatus Kapabacteria bacterium]|nr:apolipoprotein N-acyltransferase [Candidatus Kapabacteria bacterium]